jgi:hypothetical protein
MLKPDIRIKMSDQNSHFFRTLLAVRWHECEERESLLIEEKRTHPFVNRPATTESGWRAL